MNQTIVLRPEISLQDIRPGCFAILALDDARDLLHFGGHAASQPVALRVELFQEGDATGPLIDETVINLRICGAPRAAMELLPPDNGFRAISDLNGVSCVALTKWICGALDCRIDFKAMTVEEGDFDSDAAGKPGFECATVQTSIQKSLLGHIRSLSNHQRLALTKATQIHYLAA